MGLENTHPDFKPDEFNVNWPEGTDDQKYGDDHIRLIKLASYNHYGEFEAYQLKIDGLFTGNKVKEAIQADNAAKLNNEDPDQFARIDGNYAGLRAQATTKEDVGLSRVDNFYSSNSVTSGSTTNFATSYAVKIAYDKAVDALNKANSISSYGSVGSYVFAEEISDKRTPTEPGSTRPGSQLAPTGSTDYNGTTTSSTYLRHFSKTSATLSGTWRCMGYSYSNDRNVGGTLRNAATLWVRIS